MKIVIDIPETVYEAYKEWHKNKVATVEQSLIANGTPYIEPITIKLSDEDKEQFINMMRDPKFFHGVLVADKQEDDENEQTDRC